MFKNLVLAISVLFTTQAFAELAVRVHYGTMNAPKGFNTDLAANIPGTPSVPAPSALGGDLLYVMPVMPFEFGARYETMSGKGSNSVADVKFEGTRISALGGYRFINTLAYVGVLAHVGLSSTAKVHLTLAGQSTDTMKGKVDTSYGVGAEAGFKFLMFTAGAEVGYDMFKIKSLTDSTGATQQLSGKDASLDFSGVYMKALLGLSF